MKSCALKGLLWETPVLLHTVFYLCEIQNVFKQEPGKVTANLSTTDALPDGWMGKKAMRATIFRHRHWGNYYVYTSPPMYFQPINFYNQLFTNKRFFLPRNITIVHSAI